MTVPRMPSFDGHWLAVSRPRDYEWDALGVYDEEVKAQNVARMHWRDTGEFTEVYRLSASHDQEQP